MEILISLVAVAAMGIAIYALVRGTRMRTVASLGATTLAASGQEELTVTVPVENVDTKSPATRRLVNDTARRVFAADPAVMTVIVLSAGGRELGRVPRTVPQPSTLFVDLPTALYEPHAPRHPGPRIEREDEVGVHVQPRFVAAERETHRTLAEHFDLSEPVRRRISRPNDPGDIVRAILGEAGVRYRLEDHVIRCGDVALIVIGPAIGGVVHAEDLNVAFLRFQRSGAKRGVVVTTGLLPTQDVRRRESLAPELLHTGPEGIQRMADAVSMGADPVDFVVQIPISRT